jgi:glucosamine 6-phosphate synthetase-like amidotransferase/phosphosugar isomerase protein
MGFACFGNVRPNKDNITEMFSLLETRGRDASGFAFIQDGQLVVNKAPIKSSLFVKTEDWQKLELPKIMILHTRAATQGSNKIDANNHPLFSKQGVAIVHNGIIYNDKDIFSKTHRRDGEVDSEAILHVLSSKYKGDKIKRVFDKLDGSFAFASINKEDPEKLILVKKDNPIDLYFDIENDILYFCSERRIMQEALKLKSQTLRGFNLGEGNYHFYEMKNNHGLIFNSEGVESYERYHPRKFNYIDTDYRFSTRDDEMLIECPYCLSSTTYIMGKLFNRCESCGMAINEEGLYNI